MLWCSFRNLKLMSEFYRCNCFARANIFIKKYKLHFTYEDDNQFWGAYESILRKLGCTTEEEKDLLLQKIKAEVRRRQNIEVDSCKRQKAIKTSYVPYNPDVYHLKEYFLEPLFVKLANAAVNAVKVADILPMIDIISDDKQLYGFPVFTSEFCHQLLAELEHFELSPMPKGRPNSMNKHGVLLEELGFYPDFIDTLRTRFLSPIAKCLFPDWCGTELDSHRAFTVCYCQDQDKDLDFHYDNAEVTLNICLGQIFTGGELYFGDMRNVPLSESTCTIFEHMVGYGILHRGQQMHGALPISSGIRHNLIIWMRSSSVRIKKCPMCDESPVLVPSESYGDGFTYENRSSTILSMCSLL